MATKQIWLNLPVNNVILSRKFFTELGFQFNERHIETDASAQCMLIGASNFVVMLFPNETFKNFTQIEINNTLISSEMLISFDAESREEVDELAKKVVVAGGKLYSNPTEVQGWMYGFGFCDIDGHRWNVLHMDESKI